MATVYDGLSALDNLGLQMDDLSSALQSENWPVMAMNEGGGTQLEDPSLFGIFGGGEQMGQGDGESLWSRFRDWWDRLTGGWNQPRERYGGYRGYGGYGYQNPQNYSYERPSVSTVSTVGECKNELHKIFNYEMTKEIRHLYVHAHKKMEIFHILKRRIEELDKTIEVFDEFIQSSINAYRQTGSLADKKNAMLAEVENTKHRLHLQFLVGLAHLMKKAIWQEMQVAKQYSEKYL